MARDRQTESEAAVLAGESRVTLAEPLENVRQEFRLDPGAGISHRDRHRLAIAFDAHLDVAVPGRELDGVGNEIPDNLLQPIGIGGDLTELRIDVDGHPDALGVGGRQNRRNRIVHQRRHVDRLQVEP